jgi:hypothetical protein
MGLANAEDITVRVISAKNGHPFKDERVQVTVTRPPHLPDPQSPFAFNQFGSTDGDGKAIFHLDVPRVSSLTVMVSNHLQCSAFRYQFEDVLRTGVAKENCPHRPKGKFGLPVHPGEIVIYIGEYSWLERALYFPWPN